MIDNNASGQPSRCRIANSPPRHTIWNTFVKSINTTISGLCCSKHFSWSCWSVKIMSKVEQWSRNPHRLSGRIRSGRTWSIGRITRARALPTTERRAIHLYLLQSCRLPLFLYELAVTVFFRSWGLHCERQQSNRNLHRWAEGRSHNVEFLPWFHQHQEFLKFFNSLASARIQRFSQKNSSFWMLYQRPSSSADCARELFNGSNGLASLVDCSQKNIFCLGGAGFFVSDVISRGLSATLAHFVWPWVPTVRW